LTCDETGSVLPATSPEETADAERIVHSLPQYFELIFSRQDEVKRIISR